MTAESPIPDTVPRAAAEPGARDLLEREFASRILRDLPGLSSFKVVQESRERTRVLLVAGPGFDRGREGEIVRGFKRRLGEAVQVVVEFVDHIPAEKSGKFRYIVSHATAGQWAG